MNMNEVMPPKRLVENKANLIFKALSSSQRRNLLTLLRDEEECVCHLEAYTGYRQAYISQQLKVLRDAGLITDQRIGWNIYYRVVDPAIFTLMDDVAHLTGQPPESVRKLKTACSCPKCNQNLKNSN